MHDLFVPGKGAFHFRALVLPASRAAFDVGKEKGDGPGWSFSYTLPPDFLINRLRTNFQNLSRDRFKIHLLAAFHRRFNFGRGHHGAQ